jgi:Na+/phosphate symporter
MLGNVLVHGVGERMTRRFAGMVVGSQTLVVFLGALVAWAIAKAQHTAHTSYLVVGLVLALLCIIAAGTLRRPWGVTLGWVVQCATLLAGIVLPMMFVVGLMFLALWVTALVQGRKMDELTARHDEETT